MFEISYAWGVNWLPVSKTGSLMGSRRISSVEEALPRLYSKTVHPSPFDPHFPFWLKILPFHWLLIVMLLEAPGPIWPGWGPVYEIAGLGTPPEPGVLQPL